MHPCSRQRQWVQATESILCLPRDVHLCFDQTVYFHSHAQHISAGVDSICSLSGCNCVSLVFTVFSQLYLVTSILMEKIRVHMG